MQLVQANATVESTRIVVSQVRHGEFVEEIPVLGTVEPMHTVHLDAIEGGTVEEVLTEDGSRVQEGDLILRLSNSGLLNPNVALSTPIYRAKAAR